MAQITFPIELYREAKKIYRTECIPAKKEGQQAVFHIANKMHLPVGHAAHLLRTKLTNIPLAH